MSERELSTEDSILKAAEAEFLEKGYGNAKTVAIARRAGVSHSMLHYYFRTKERLFQRIFLQKVQTLALFFEDILEQQLPFPETVRRVVEYQFNFVAQNPKLPYFIIGEVISNRENRMLLFETLSPRLSGVFAKMEQLLSEEIAKGTIRPIHVRDFIMNIVSLNVSTFIVLPFLQEITPAGDKPLPMETLLKERQESNVQFILQALKP
jgi:AcrR family transcriptional regulator